MKNVVILCNGEFPRKAYPLYLLESADAVVCCDGAVVKYARKFGEKLPEAVIGDMDSLPKSWRGSWRRLSCMWRNRTTMT